ncbi:hypothetical protein [Rossellomorea sp. BNER]|nr:hypothetical protein [Rossellomorea sp. BNER]
MLGLVASAEIADVGVLLIDHKPEASFGRLFLVDSPEKPVYKDIGN